MRVGAVLFVAMLTGGLVAQQPAAVTLDGVLEQLQMHLDEYRKTVPDLFCSEHVLSSVQTRRTHIATVTDSTFRLRKTTLDDGTVSFEESRLVLAVGGERPLTKRDTLSGPAILSGVFSDGLRMVSREVKGCYDYTLTAPRVGHPKDKMLVRFKDIREGRPYECPPYEGTWGQATIDPVTMRVVKLEKTTPDPQKRNDGNATWTWTVEYAPVPLSGKTFWMPKTIRSTSRTEAGDSVWTFEGSYRDYHLFHGEARIVPVGP